MKSEMKLPDGMKLLDARWTPAVNIIHVGCRCGCRFDHRLDRWMVRCPRCGAVERVDGIREQPLPLAPC